MPKEMSSLLKNIGARLAGERERIGLSQTAMAAALGISRRAYHNYENGITGVPIEKLLHLHAHYDIDIVWILLEARSKVPKATDLEVLENAMNEIDEFIDTSESPITPKDRNRLVVKWFESFLTGDAGSSIDIKVWANIAKGLL